MYVDLNMKLKHNNIPIIKFHQCIVSYIIHLGSNDLPLAVKCVYKTIIVWLDDYFITCQETHLFWKFLLNFYKR